MRYRTQNICRLALIALWVLFGMTATLNAAESSHIREPERKHILVISSWATHLPWSQEFLRGIAEEANAHEDQPIDIFTEYLDKSRLGQAITDEEWVTFIKRKYKSIQLDAVIADSTSAVNLVFNDGSPPFGDIPCVLIPSTPLDTSRLKYSAIISLGPIIRGTVLLALQQNPNPQQIILIGDESPEPQLLLQELIPIVTELAPQAKIIIKSKFQIQELEQYVSRLPRHSVIIFTLVLQDESKRHWRPVDVVKQLAAHASVPIYVFYDPLIGNGAVGGYVQGAAKTGKLAIKAAQNLIAATEKKPSEHLEYTVADTVLDWRALKKWNISAASIPPDAEIRYREHSLFEEYFFEAITAIFLILLEGALLITITLLFIQRKNLSRKLIEINTTLEERVAERTRELYQIATHDDLTGLYNRQEFYRRARQEMSRFRHYGHIFTLGILDIDKFKSINDSYGHPAGDLVLKAFASTIASYIRVNDTLGRIGGEEFAILLPETSLEEAEITFNKVHKKIENMVIMLSNDQGIHITVSIGVSVSKQEDLDIEAIVKRADKRLYLAKTGGRNQVVYRG